MEYPGPLKSESELESSGFGVLVALLIAVEERLEEGTYIQVHSSGLTVQPGAEDMTVEPALAVKAKDCSLPSWGSGDRERGTPCSTDFPTFSFNSVWIPVYGLMPWIQDGSFPLGQSSLETPSQACPEERLMNALGIY